MSKGGDFFIESKGYCFLCLNSTLAKTLPFVKLESEPDFALPSPMQYSLRSLSNYLKLDMKKVFHEWENVPPDLLAKVERSNLKVELCEECANVIQKFSLVHRQFEKIEMEVISVVNLIQGKLLEVHGTEQFSKIGKLNNSVDTPRDDWIGKLDVLKVLREETILKCSRILNTTSPRVKVRMLTKRKVTQAKLQIKRRSPKIMTASQQYPDSKEFRNGQTEEETFIKQEGPGESLFDSDYEPVTPDMGTDSEEDSNNQKMSSTSHVAKSNFEQQPRSKISSNDSWVVITSCLMKKYKCALCEKSFTQRVACHQHYQSVHLSVRHDCPACKRSFTYVRYLKKHLQKTSCGTKVKLKPKQGKQSICHCRHCGKGFTAKYSLRKHFEEVPFEFTGACVRNLWETI